MEVALLKEKVYEANQMLPRYGLVTFTWGNVSEYDKQTGLVAIKPSGVEYSDMTVDDIVVMDLSGNIVEGSLNPSSDAPTHLELYRQFEDIGGIVHTHSRYATAFAQAKCSIPVMGTTHGDYFYGDIPCTRDMIKSEILTDYELNTGKVIVECCPSYRDIPAIVVANHAPFVWGKSGVDAVHNAVVLEEISAIAWLTLTLSKDTSRMGQDLLDKHFLRKHGKNAYYGQV